MRPLSKTCSCFLDINRYQVGVVFFAVCFISLHIRQHIKMYTQQIIVVRL
ncbi:hypothetical protein ACE6H2_019633 [Prunus campanulata]